MYNSDIPTRAELPTSAQLVESTILAIVAAAVILVTIVLPAEYAIDPTGVGRMLKLTEMGEIKNQLAAEAEADAKKDAEQKKPAGAQSDRRSSLGNILGGFLITPAAASDRIVVAQTSPAPAPTTAAPVTRQDENVIVLKPTEGVEWKMDMPKGAKVQYSWTAEGGVVNFDMHGTQKSGKESSYKKGRGAKSDEGSMTAAYDGTHGWFWRNRGKADVKITLKTNGAYSNLHQIKK